MNWSNILVFGIILHSINLVSPLQLNESSIIKHNGPLNGYKVALTQGNYIQVRL